MLPYPIDKERYSSAAPDATHAELLYLELGNEINYYPTISREDTSRSFTTIQSTFHHTAALTPRAPIAQLDQRNMECLGSALQNDNAFPLSEATDANNEWELSSSSGLDSSKSSESSEFGESVGSIPTPPTPSTHEQCNTDDLWAELRRANVLRHSRTTTHLYNKRERSSSSDLSSESSESSESLDSQPLVPLNEQRNMDDRWAEIRRANTLNFLCESDTSSDFSHDSSDSFPVLYTLRRKPQSARQGLPLIPPAPRENPLLQPRASGRGTRHLW